MIHLYKNNPEFTTRYILPENLHLYLKNFHEGQIQLVGKSFLQKPIYKLQFGTGKIKMVAWSQMHGNESNSTLAMLDLLYLDAEFPEIFENIKNAVTLDFIFMLNPDGSEKWARLNAQDLDLNRDFHANATAELKILKSVVAKGDYHYALNLHEQRTIFSTDGSQPATLSFLAPSESVERTITENRKRSMAVIAKIVEKMQDILPNRMAKYSDEFYPNATGDNFSKNGLPTILFEGGHFENDYTRKETRKYYATAIFYALEAIADLKMKTDGWEKYLEIPENKESHYDVIYRNVKLNTEHYCVLDIGVQFKEIIQPRAEEISFIPYVVAVGDMKGRKGWEEIDCTGKTFVSKTKYPKIDYPVAFTFE